MASQADLSQAISAIAAAGPVEVRENGQRVAALDSFHYEVREHASRVVLHLWSEQRSLARRVLRVVELGQGQILLEVEHFGRTKPDRLEIVAASAQSPARVTREKFRERLAGLLQEQFPDEEIESLTSAADLEHSLSGRYARGVMRVAGTRWALLAAPPDESSASIDAMLAFGLLWLQHARGHDAAHPIAGLRLFLPAGAAKAVVHRLAALHADVAIELYELDETSGRLRRARREEFGNLFTSLTPRREAEAILLMAQAAIDPIRRLARGAIAAHVVPGTSDIALRFRGAEFAQWRDGTVFFGLGDQRRVLNSERQAELLRLVRELELHRHAAAANTSHPLFRMQAERWLETCIAADPLRIDARLDRRFLYTQVPAFSGGDRGVIDLLGVTHEGRLAILELKADEDIHLVLQAADYWLRVRAHQLHDDFRSYGYFPGVDLRPEPPLVFLVAPAIRFHPATDTLLRYICPEMEVTRVGLAENWRSGLRVVLRQ
jgi:hypothetical protein